MILAVITITLITVLFAAVISIRCLALCSQKYFKFAKRFLPYTGTDQQFGRKIITAAYTASCQCFEGSSSVWCFEQRQCNIPPKGFLTLGWGYAAECLRTFFKPSYISFQSNHLLESRYPDTSNPQHHWMEHQMTPKDTISWYNNLSYTSTPTGLIEVKFTHSHNAKDICPIREEGKEILCIEVWDKITTELTISKFIISS